MRLAARRAVRSLGLDFGAADVLVDRDGGVYTLEVNTAPSVADPTSTTFDRYVEAITAIATCHEDGWAAALAVAERSPATSRSPQRNEGNQDA